jgi:hypothetical protein
MARLSGRGSPVKRGFATGVMTTLGGLGHALPYLIPDFWTATIIAVMVVFVELWAIAWIQNRYMDTPFCAPRSRWCWAARWSSRRGADRGRSSTFRSDSGNSDIEHHRQADDLRAGLEVAKGAELGHAETLPSPLTHFKPGLSDRTRAIYELITMG